VLKYPLEKRINMSISLKTLEILDASLKRLRQYNGHFHPPKSVKTSLDKAALPFWFSEPKYVPLYVFTCNAHCTDYKYSDYDMNDAITSVDGTVTQYQTTVRRYKLALAAFSSLSRSLEMQLRRMDAIMRPIALANGISKVPDDVLARIFECIYEPWPKEPYARPKPEDLRLVCKRFKRVADFQLLLRHDFSSKMPIGRIERVINQQVQAGLRVEINEHSCYSNQSADNIAAFAKTLVPLAHRWEDLRFFHVKPTETITQAYEKFKSLDLPRLERLTLWSENFAVADDIYSTWTVPKLRSVVIYDGVPMKLPGKSNILECELIIEKYDLKNCIPDAAKFLQSLASLTSLRLTFQEASLVGTYDLKIGPIHLPNLRSFQADLYFTQFNNADKYDYELETLSDTGEVIYRFIGQLVTPQIDQVRVNVSHDTCWNEWTKEFLCNLFRTHGKSSTLRTLEFSQEGHRLSANYSFKSIFGCPLNSNVVLSGLLFDSSDRSLFKLKVPEHDQGPLGLRTLTFKDCRLSIGALEAFLKLYTSGVYPNFEGIILIQCAGVCRESLRGVVGSEYVFFSYD
jgi:hypothetical protein